MRRLERIDGGVAAHEADHGALDRRVEPEMIDNFKIETGRVEARAGSDDLHASQMPRSSLFGESQPVERGARQLRRESAQRTSCGGLWTGKVSLLIDLFSASFQRAVSRWEAGFTNEKRCSMAREARHALEEISRCAFRKQAGGKGDEGLMHVKRGNRGGDAIDVGCRHGCTSETGKSTL
jgi:hypothetical protein